MNTFTVCRRLIAAAALLGYLGLGAAQPAAADTATINQYGYWASVLDIADGQRVCGVQTHMVGGGELRLMVIGGEVHLAAHDSDWTMSTDATSRVTLTVDDQTFAGTGKAIDGQTLLVMDLTEDFLRQFVEGSEMRADFGGVHWTVNLIGSGRATNDMASCIAATRQGLMS